MVKSKSTPYFRDNHLIREDMRQMGITESIVADMIENSRCAWVATEYEKIIGFSMILPDEGCLSFFPGI